MSDETTRRDIAAQDCARRDYVLAVKAYASACEAGDQVAAERARQMAFDFLDSWMDSLWGAWAGVRQEKNR